jgi:hypothetical protein
MGDGRVGCSPNALDQRGWIVEVVTVQLDAVPGS